MGLVQPPTRYAIFITVSNQFFIQHPWGCWTSSKERIVKPLRTKSRCFSFLLFNGPFNREEKTVAWGVYNWFWQYSWWIFGITDNSSQLNPNLFFLQTLVDQLEDTLRLVSMGQDCIHMLYSQFTHIDGLGCTVTSSVFLVYCRLTAPVETSWPSKWWRCTMNFLHVFFPCDFISIYHNCKWLEGPIEIVSINLSIQSRQPGDASFTGVYCREFSLAQNFKKAMACSSHVCHGCHECNANSRESWRLENGHGTLELHVSLWHTQRFASCFQILSSYSIASCHKKPS